jgi:hypothetical protein
MLTYKTTGLLGVKKDARSEKSSVINVEKPVSDENGGRENRPWLVYSIE